MWSSVGEHCPVHRLSRASQFQACAKTNDITFTGGKQTLLTMPSEARNRSPSPLCRRAAVPDDQGRQAEPHRSRSPKRPTSGAASLAEGHRYRSRSPKPRSPPAAEEAKPKKKKIAGGFKFKDKSAGEDYHDKDRDQATKGLERGYRDRGTEREPQPSTQSNETIREKFGAGASIKDKFGDVKVGEKFGSPATSETPVEGKKEKKRDRSKPSTAQPTMEMIVVYVNDRLGTRAQIMCSPSDTISMYPSTIYTFLLYSIRPQMADLVC